MTTEKLGQMLKEHLALHHFGVFFIKGFEVCLRSRHPFCCTASNLSSFQLAQGLDCVAKESHESIVRTPAPTILSHTS